MIYFKYIRLGLILPVMAVFVSIFWLAWPTAQANTLPLTGIHRFKGGDDPQWSRPDLDDRRWAPITVPGSWQSQNMAPKKCMGWYRIRFSCPERHGWTQPALMLGQVGNADQVFLNGVPIGSEGVFGDRFVDSSYSYRVYPIPAKALHAGGDNLLAVRVMNDFRQGGILGGPVCIGELADLTVVKVRNEYGRKVVEAGFFAFSSFFFLMSLFLYASGARETEYLAFAALIALCGMMYFLDSLIFYDTGLKTPLVQQVINAATAFLPAAGLFFLLILYKLVLRLWSIALIVVNGMLALGFLVSFSFDADRLLLDVWIPVALAVMGACLIIAISARVKRRPESRPILLGVSALVAGAIIETLGIMDPPYYQNLDLFDLGFGFFLVCIAYALIARHSRLRREVHLLSGRILDAHEKERNRLSREIHDGIGQALFAVKLHLEMLRAKAGAEKPLNKEAFSEIIAGISHSISELRRVVFDLRPAVLERASFVEALKWYGSKYAEQSGIGLVVEGDETLDLPLRRKDHLYRIFQEALSNIRRHAQADCVNVRVEKKGKLLSFLIADNGRGFDSAKVAEQESGLGLTTIRERTELLGGTFTLKSSPGRGTQFIVEVPIE